MKIKDMKIGTRLRISFFSILVLMTLVMAAGIWLLRDLDAATDYMINDAIAKERLVTEWHKATQMNGFRTMAVAKTADADELQGLEKKIKATSKRIDELKKQLEALLHDSTDKTLYEETSVKRAAYLQARSEVFRAKNAGDLESVKKLTDSRLEPALSDYLDSISKLSEYQNKKARDVALKVDAQGASGQYMLAGLWLTALLAGIVGSILTTRSITRPLHRAIDVAETVARGDLTSRIDAPSKDETGQLLAALKEMNQSLIRIVGEVRRGTDTIATASHQIAAGNLELSSRTEQQASSLEETASSMEEMTGTVRQNADNARQANQLAASASEVAIKGGAVVAQVVDTMSTINDSSRKIVDIIGVIDGIAFQTNILALNAAVEAARAGEQGRGFAVVAAEVRSLAQRSAAAAKEIKSLIDDSVDKVGIGAKLVNEAGATMNEVVESVKRVTGIIAEITTASEEQSSGIDQINRAITQMDQVTQQNAALVEEAAAAADALQEQAANLTQAVSVFKLDSEHHAVVAPLVREA